MSVTSDIDDQPFAYRSPKHTLFDGIAFNMITYLDSFEEVCDVEVISHSGAQPVEINLWDRKNSPYELPNDIKGFYSLFNGFVLRWKVEVADQEIIIGEIKLLKLENIVPIALSEGTTFVLPTDVSSGLIVTVPDVRECVAFSLSSYEEGQVALLYRRRPISLETSSPTGDFHMPPEMPEIWFQDNTGAWHFICYSFTQYMRLCVMHLGIIGWLHMFTPEGISMTCRQWMGMFCKERLCVYEHSRPSPDG